MLAGRVRISMSKLLVRCDTLLRLCTLTLTCPRSMQRLGRDSLRFPFQFEVACMCSLQVMGVLNEKKAELKAVQANVI